MIKSILLTIAVIAAGVLAFAGLGDAASRTYRSTQESAASFDSGRCFNRCLAYRGYRPASMRVGYCNRRCQ